MTLRVKSLLVVGAVLTGLYILIVIGSLQILLVGFTKIERVETIRNVERAEQALKKELQQLDQLCIDWANWDESYNFINNPNQNFKDWNLNDETFLNLRLANVLFIGLDGKVVYGKSLDLYKKTEQAAPSQLLSMFSDPKTLLFTRSLKNNCQPGIVMTESGLLLVTARPILTSNSRGPARGILVLTRQADEQFMRRLSNQLKLELTLKPLGKGNQSLKKHEPEFPHLKVINKETIAGFAQINDLENHPALIIQVVSSRNIYLHGKNTISYFLLSILAVGIVLGTIIQILLVRLLVSEEKQRESEVYFQSVAEQTGEGIFIVDLADKVFLEANKAFRKMTGYSLPELKQKTLYDLLPDETRYSNDILKTDHKSFSLRRKDGSLYDLEFSLSPLTLKGREVLCVIAHDITEHRKRETLLQENFAKVRQILDETVLALAAVSEKRDPFTAGHQRRVSQLACAIAREIGLTEHQTEGLRVAGILHDIGKIYIPAEILSKPGRISEIEYSLIKTHPQMGYDILKTVAFDWPVARIVLEHHERINGSGYPSGILGEAILPEAKILAVADVVEAIASHRPYRPARGIDAAFEEIKANRGQLYEPAVVDACLRVFEKGYKLE